MWQQASESEFLDKLSDAIMIIEGETGAVVPWSCSRVVCVSCAFLPISVDRAEC